MSGDRAILIVDDDRALRSLLVEQFAVDGEFTAVEAGSVGEAETCLVNADNRFEAIILDVGLPDGDGRDYCARLRAQVRIFENSEDAVFTIGPYTFRPSAKLLQEPARNRRIRLTEKESAILKFLYRAGTQPVARQVLLNEVWGYNAAVTTHTLETHIYRLRQKIEPDPSNARLLVTEGGGYRLDPEGIPAVPA
jgi:DNA-binding response OmpR family regulator